MSTWLALHIFHAADQDGLLLDAVQPALRRLRKEGELRRFFFIRYWNGGPHLRLRMEYARTAAAVEAAVRDTADAWLRAHPSPPPDPTHYHALAARIRATHARLAPPGFAEEAAEALQPPDTIQRRPYVFDTGRYGDAGMDDFHTHAWRASQLALAVLEIAPGERGLAAGFALHACAIAARVLGVDDARTAALFADAAQWPGEDADPSWNGTVGNAALLDGAGGSGNAAWDMLLAAWRGELERRLAILRAAPASQAAPEALVFDGLHLFCNRLGLTLDLECRLYRLLCAQLRARGAILEERVSV